MRDHAARLIVREVAVFFDTEADFDFVVLVHFAPELRRAAVNQDLALLDERVRLATGAVVLVREVFVDAHGEGGVHADTLA